MDFNACNANVNKVLVEQFEKQFNPDQNKQLCSIGKRHKVIAQLQTIEVFGLLCLDCLFLPWHMEEFCKLEP